MGLKGILKDTLVTGIKSSSGFYSNRKLILWHLLGTVFVLLFTAKLSIGARIKATNKADFLLNKTCFPEDEHINNKNGGVNEHCTIMMVWGLVERELNPSVSHGAVLINRIVSSKLDYEMLTEEISSWCQIALITLTFYCFDITML
ncbi:hypothetical protein CHUAL_000411 [Chamberlinius hualienensis]